MPLFKTAQRKSLLEPAVDDYYVFPEIHKYSWFKFFEAMDADEDKIIAWAEQADIKHPKAWYESLHRFLFDVYSGTPVMLKKAAKSLFSDFLLEVHGNHAKNPKPDYWYHQQQITSKRFLEVLEEAAAIEGCEQAIRYINARIMNLGFYLYSEYILSKTDFYKQVKHVASQKNKQAYDLESLVLGRAPVDIHEGDTFCHAFCAEDKFVADRIVYDDPDQASPSVIIARNENNVPFFFTDLWNLRLQK